MAETVIFQLKSTLLKKHIRALKSQDQRNRNYCQQLEFSLGSQSQLMNPVLKRTALPLLLWKFHTQLH